MTKEPHEQEAYNGLKLKIWIDQTPINPREYDNLGTILYSSSSYLLGDENVNKEDINKIASDKDVIIHSVYAYIHSGTLLKLTPFSCSWDSGCSGIIFARKEKVREWFDCKRITEEIKKKVYEQFKAELEEFTAYLNGDVYGYTIENQGGEEVDSCWGFYDETYAIDACRGAADMYLRMIARKRAKKLKALIRHRVPLLKRTEIMNNVY